MQRVVDKKLREARFFLGKMTERAAMGFGGHEEFDFYLSAFLNAGRSAESRLRYVEPSTYRAFYRRWYRSLPSEERDVARFMMLDVAQDTDVVLFRLRNHPGVDRVLLGVQWFDLIAQLVERLGPVYPSCSGLPDLPPR